MPVTSRETTSRVLDERAARDRPDVEPAGLRQRRLDHAEALALGERVEGAGVNAGATTTSVNTSRIASAAAPSHVALNATMPPKADTVSDANAAR